MSLLLKRIFLPRKGDQLLNSVVTRWRSDKLVLGCGSNVVDHIYNVKVIPNAGQKGFFQNPFVAVEHKLIGGVTLNHLSWAALGGVQCGLMALQGQDDLGHFIRTKLQTLKVHTSFIKTDSHFATSQCHVFIQEDGERSIVMAPASTSQITAQGVQQHFEKDIQNHASMLTTEISQVPLNGVLEMLKTARSSDVLSVLDLDVPPSVAVNEAMLGSIEEVLECVRSTDILKPTKEAAWELLSLLRQGTCSAGIKEPADVGESLHEISQELIKLCDLKLIAITDGSQGSILANTDSVVTVEAPTVHKVIDTTGAGDAYLGGLLVGLQTLGMPSGVKDLRSLGMLANAYGAACTQTVGGVPVSDSR